MPTDPRTAMPTAMAATGPARLLGLAATRGRRTTATVTSRPPTRVPGSRATAPRTKVTTGRQRASSVTGPRPGPSAIAIRLTCRRTGIPGLRTTGIPGLRMSTSPVQPLATTSQVMPPPTAVLTRRPTVLEPRTRSTRPIPIANRIPRPAGSLPARLQRSAVASLRRRGRRGRVHFWPGRAVRLRRNGRTSAVRRPLRSQHRGGHRAVPWAVRASSRPAQAQRLPAHRAAARRDGIVRWGSSQLGGRWPADGHPRRRRHGGRAHPGRLPAG